MNECRDESATMSVAVNAAKNDPIAYKASGRLLTKNIINLTEQTKSSQIIPEK